MSLREPCVRSSHDSETARLPVALNRQPSYDGIKYHAHSPAYRAGPRLQCRSAQELAVSWCASRSDSTVFLHLKLMFESVGSTLLAALHAATQNITSSDVVRSRPCA